MFNNLLYKNNTLSFVVYTEDGKSRDIYLNYQVKRNWSCFKYRDIIPINIISCVRYFFSVHEYAYWNEGEEYNRIIDKNKLRKLNNCINDEFQKYNYSKNIVVRNIQIEYII